MVEKNLVLILGYGRSGRAAERLAQAQGFLTRVFSVETGTPLVPPAELALLVPKVAWVVVSPGFALTHPWVVACQAAGLSLTSELAFGVRHCAGLRLLAVTGSKGKSSVVKVVADTLTRCGQPAVACGNYGKPVSEVALEGASGLWRWAVVEVSSFQLETTNLPAASFVAAAILNLQEDHLDRHGSVAVYHALKRRLLTMTTCPIASPKALHALAPLVAGSYFDNVILGENGWVAARLMQVAGLTDTQIQEGFAAFEPLPHRMKEVGNFAGVRYIDDSKATSLAALAAGVEMAGSGVRLIAGGMAKGDNPFFYKTYLTKRVKKVYLIGRCAKDFFTAWSDVVACELCGTLERAFESAKRDAKPGETVLLSPGTASFDQFKSYGERGDIFAQLVKKERKEKK